MSEKIIVIIYEIFKKGDTSLSPLLENRPDWLTRSLDAILRRARAQTADYKPVHPSLPNGFHLVYPEEW